jgi:hypothetical protein
MYQIENKDTMGFHNESLIRFGCEKQINSRKGVRITDFLLTARPGLFESFHVKSFTKSPHFALWTKCSR